MCWDAAVFRVKQSQRPSIATDPHNTHTRESQHQVTLTVAACASQNSYAAQILLHLVWPCRSHSLPALLVARCTQSQQKQVDRIVVHTLRVVKSPQL